MGNKQTIAGALVGLFMGGVVALFLWEPDPDLRTAVDDALLCIPVATAVIGGRIGYPRMSRLWLVPFLFFGLVTLESTKPCNRQFSLRSVFAITALIALHIGAYRYISSVYRTDGDSMGALALVALVDFSLISIAFWIAGLIRTTLILALVFLGPFMVRQAILLHYLEEAARRTLP